MTFKVESHNHPSYVEPYQGAATGVGGIVRDIMSMGARPVAVHGPAAVRRRPTAPTPLRVLPGVVAGIGGYGNCLGLPNIGGEVVFDASYHGNPLVNALCVGRHAARGHPARDGRGAGNQVVLFGAKTGGDGIGGVSVLASETFDEGGPTKRPACRSATRSRRRCSSSAASRSSPPSSSSASRTSAAPGCPARPAELASNGDGGMHVGLDRVPLRDSSLRPEEILMSESQERMCAVVEPRELDAFLAICGKWDVAGRPSSAR